MVPVGYVFEDDVCDNEVSPRGRKRDLKTREEAEATGAPKRDPARVKVEEPGTGEAQSAGRKRRRRPKKSERSLKVLQLNSDSFCDHVRILGAVIGHLEAEKDFCFFPRKW
jgi:hypothetical protein